MWGQDFIYFGADFSDGFLNRRPSVSVFCKPRRHANSKKLSCDHHKSILESHEQSYDPKQQWVSCCFWFDSQFVLVMIPEVEHSLSSFMVLLGHISEGK